MRFDEFYMEALFLKVVFGKIESTHEHDDVINEARIQT